MWCHIPENLTVKCVDCGKSVRVSPAEMFINVDYLQDGKVDVYCKCGVRVSLDTLMEGGADLCGGVDLTSVAGLIPATNG